MPITRRTAALFAALALLTAACGGTGDDADTEPTTEPTDESPAEDGDASPEEEPADEEAADQEPAGEEAAGDDAEGPLTIYSGRSEELVDDILHGFTDSSGIEVEIRYGDTAELAATIINEGEASPADVYYAQDAGALGALQAEGLFAPLPEDVLAKVDPAFASDSGEWVGVTGRVRVMAYNTETMSEDEVPDSVFDLTDPEWAGRVSWAPTNGSFQSFVTAMRVTEGEEATREWLEGMIANDVQVFENNSSQVEAAGRGEVDIALVNHYYLLRFLAEDPDFPVANKYLSGDIGGLVNVSGVGVLASSDQPDAAEQFVAYMLSDEVQNFFGSHTDEREIPAASGIQGEGIPSIDELDPPAIDLSDLDDLQGTLQLLQETGALQ